jgi:hypothetical protein
MIARCELGDLAPYTFHDTGGLVAQYCRATDVEDATQMIEIAVTQTGRCGGDQDLMWPRIIDVDVLNREYLCGITQYGCFHGFSSDSFVGLLAGYWVEI